MKNKKPKKLKIFHGIINISGIPRTLSDYERGKGLISDSYQARENIYGKPCHYSIGMDDEFSRLKNLAIRTRFFLKVLFKYNTFNFYYKTSLLPKNLDLPILKLFRKKIIMIYCGSDIRQIDVESTINPYIKYIAHEEDRPEFDKKKRRQMRFHKLFIDKIITIRDLVIHAEQVFPPKKIITNLWIHNVTHADLPDVTPDQVRTKNPPLLVHAPTHQGFKGTKYVREAIERLKANNYNFIYKEAYKLPYHEARQLYKNADIIIDQFLGGCIGTLAMEGMHLGKVVVAYIPKQRFDKHFTSECPVYNSTIDNLDTRLAELIDDKSLRVRLGKQGIYYVNKFCNKEKTCNNLINLYEKLWHLEPTKF